MGDPDATIELCRPEHETEALGIEAELRAHGVDPLLERRASTAYPGIVDRGGWGVIRVREDQASRARLVLVAWLEERGSAEVDEEELAAAAMEADDSDPDELVMRRAQLAKVDRGGAYRASEGLAKSQPAGALVVKKPRPKWSTVLLLASLGLNLLLIWEQLRARGEIAFDAASLVDEVGHRHGLSCP